MALYRMGMRSGRGVLGCYGSDGAGKQAVGGSSRCYWLSRFLTSHVHADQDGIVRSTHI